MPTATPPTQNYASLVLVVRHAEVDKTTLCVTLPGLNRVQQSIAVITKAYPDFYQKPVFHSAYDPSNGIGAGSSCFRCDETLRVFLAPYSGITESESVSAADTVLLFKYFTTKFVTENPHSAVVMCLRLEDEINAIRSYKGLPPWTSDQGYNTMMMFHKTSNGVGGMTELTIPA